MIKRKPHARWLVHRYALNTLAIGCSIEPRLLFTDAFRWRWMARAWCWISNTSPQLMLGSYCWSEIERERPRFRVVEGGRMRRTV